MLGWNNIDKYEKFEFIFKNIKKLKHYFNYLIKLN